MKMWGHGHRAYCQGAASLGLSQDSQLQAQPRVYGLLALADPANCCGAHAAALSGAKPGRNTAAALAALRRRLRLAADSAKAPAVAWPPKQ